MRTATKNTGIATFKATARLQGAPNKAGELPLVLRYTTTKAGKTTQNIKFLSQRVAPFDFDDKAGLLKSNAPAANALNELITNRSHLLRVAASEADDASCWLEVSTRFDKLVKKQDAELLTKRVSKRLKTILPTWELEDAVAEKHRIAKEARENAKKLAELASEGFHAQSEQISEFHELLEGYPATFIKSSQKVKNQIKSWVNNLIRFSEETNTPLTFDNMSKKFYKSYGEWIFSEDNYDAWFGACVKRLNTFLNKCAADGKVINPAYKTFEVLTERKEVIYLTPSELDLVWEYEAAEEWKRKYQDICLFGNLTGLRVGDLLNSEYRVEDEMLVGRNTKNRTDFFTPLATDSRIGEILVKYDYNLNRVSEQKYNKYIKEILQEIFTKHNIHQKKIKLFHTRWTQKVPYSAYKWELISNHSSRRGFVTNMYNVHRYEIDDIKAMLGSTSNEILRYLVVEKASVKEKAEEKRKAKQLAILAKAKEKAA